MPSRAQDPTGLLRSTLGYTRNSPPVVHRPECTKRNVILLGRVDTRCWFIDNRHIGTYESVVYYTVSLCSLQQCSTRAANRSLCDSLPRHIVPVIRSSSYDNQGSRPPTSFTHLAFAVFSREASDLHFHLGVLVFCFLRLFTTTCFIHLVSYGCRAVHSSFNAQPGQ